VPLLRQTSTAAALGISPFEACADLAQQERLDSLRDLCGALAAARRGGRPLVPVLLERREVLRLAWRAERLEAASRVDGALSLVLILAYLPALLLLVVVPLFVGLLAALES
jgi:pilus assembly protein TadC